MSVPAAKRMATDRDLVVAPYVISEVKISSFGLQYCLLFL